MKRPEYTTATIQVHSMTTSDVGHSFEDVLNKFGATGYRFVYAINCSNGIYLMIFERMGGEE